MEWYCVLLSKKRDGVRILTMRYALFLICTLALFAVGFASSAHAYVESKDSNQYVEFVQDVDEKTGIDDVASFYGSPDFLNSDSNLFLLTSKMSVSFFSFVQKRPPRI